MRILYVLHQFYPEFSAGTEQVTLNLARSAQRAGHHVQVLACVTDARNSSAKPDPGFPELLQTVYQGVPITLVPLEQLTPFSNIGFDSTPALIERLSGWMTRERFDACHVLHAMRMSDALVALQRCKIPYLMTLTDFFTPCFRINLINRQGALCDGPDGGERCVQNCLVAPWTPESLQARYRHAHDLLTGAVRRICPSEYVAERFRDAFPDLEFLVIPHGIDLLALTVEEAVPRKKEDAFVFGFIGSIVPQKGVDMLLRAFARVPDPQVRLRLCGGLFGDPVHIQEVRRLMEIDPRVEWLGQVPHAAVFEMLRNLDILCLPSRVPESFSLVLHEACAAGVPALVSALGAPGALVERYAFGRAIAVDDEMAWADALRNVATDRSMVSAWRDHVPLPMRVEEEGFFYDSLYRELRPG
jgi:glycosyltransferase involved in cell wall biosynthesis